jgi:hypothetical protein
MIAQAEAKHKQEKVAIILIAKRATAQGCAMALEMVLQVLLSRRC